MIDQDELMKMAREAGGAPLIEGVSTLLFSPFDIAVFACAILDRAAVVAMLTADNGIVTSAAIRALKPQLEN